MPLPPSAARRPGQSAASQLVVPLTPGARVAQQLRPRAGPSTPSTPANHHPPVDSELSSSGQVTKLVRAQVLARSGFPSGPRRRPFVCVLLRAGSEQASTRPTGRPSRVPAGLELARPAPSSRSALDPPSPGPPFAASEADHESLSRPTCRLAKPSSPVRTRAGQARSLGHPSLPPRRPLALRHAHQLGPEAGQEEGGQAARQSQQGRPPSGLTGRGGQSQSPEPAPAAPVARSPAPEPPRITFRPPRPPPSPPPSSPRRPRSEPLSAFDLPVG